MDDNVTNFQDVHRGISGLSRLLCKHRQTIRKAIHDCRIESAGQYKGHPVYRVCEVAEAVYSVPPGTHTEMNPKERLDWYRSEIARRKLQVEDGELIPVADFDATYSRMIKLTAAALETLPDQLELDAGLSGTQLEPVIRVIDSLRESLYAALVDRDGE